MKKTVTVIDAPQMSIPEVQAALVGLEALQGFRIELQVDQDGPEQGFQVSVVLSDGLKEGTRVELDTCLNPDDFPVEDYAVTVGSILRVGDFNLACLRAIAEILCQVGEVQLRHVPGSAEVEVRFEADRFSANAKVAFEDVSAYLREKEDVQ